MKRTLASIGSAILVGALAAGCAESPAPTSPDAAEVLFSGHGSGGRQILMLDNCAPGTGFPTCDRAPAQGGLSFDKFIESLQKNQRVESWRFSPGVINVTRTVTFQVPNRGGVPHSFTEVAEFGGGFVGILNALSGNPVPAPECVHPVLEGVPHPDVVLVPAGGHDVVTLNPGEEKKFMCCIHPWMRAVTR